MLTPEEFDRLKYLTNLQGSVQPPSAPSSFWGKVGQSGKNIQEAFNRGFGPESSLTQLYQDAPERVAQAGTEGSFFKPFAEGIEHLRTGASTVPRALLGATEGLFGGAMGAVAPFLPEDVKRGGMEKIEGFLTKPRLGGASFADAIENIDEGWIRTLDTVGIKVDPTDEIHMQHLEDLKQGSLVLLDLMTLKGVSRVSRALEKGVTAVTGKVPRSYNVLPQNLIPGFVKDITRRTAPQTLEEAEDAMVRSVRTAFVEGVPSVSRKLRDLARRQSTRDVMETPDSLILKMVRQNALPFDEGGLANFSKAIESLERLQESVQKPLVRYLETIPDTIGVEDFKQMVRDAANELDWILGREGRARELERLFKDIDAFDKDRLTAVDIHQVRKDSNRLTKAFSRKDDVFAADIAYLFGKIARELLDKLDVPQVAKRANAEYARLEKIIDTVDLFDNRKIRIDPFAEQVGRLGGVLLLGGGFTALSFGNILPGGTLIIAAAFAKMGGDAVAKFLRSNKFSEKAKELLAKGIQKMGVAEELIEQTKGANKKLLEQKLLPPPGQTSIQMGPRGWTRPDTSEVRLVDAPLGEPGRVVAGEPGAGQFKRTYRSDFSEGGTPPTTQPGIFQKAVGRVKQEIENYKNLPPREKQGGFANFGASMKNTFESAGIGENEFRVGITNVAGLQRTKSDNLYQEAISLLEAGDVEKARELYKQAVDYGIKRVKDTFKDTGINVKAKPGLGVFEAVPEPSIDMVATVPAKKVDLFHYQLAKLAGEQFDQKSVITMGRSKSDNLGWVDKNMGISNEPVARFTLNKALGPEDSKEILELMNKNGLYGASIVDNGKAIDIINLSHYNNDYEGFKQSLTNFAKALDRKKILSGVEDGVAEVRHFGSDSSNGPTTYRTVQNSFESKNPEFKVAGKYQTGLTEALPKKSTYYKKEVEQALRRDTVSPMEREMMSFVLPELGDQFTYKELDNAVMKYLLRTQPNKTEQYAGYGLDSMPYNNAETTLFRTPVTHGVSGHFGTADDFGHMRTFKVAGDDNVYVSEIQADAFQRGIKPETKESLLSKIEKNKEELRRIETDKVNVPDSVRVLKDQIAQYERQLKIVEDPKYQAQLAQIKSYESGNKYRRRLLQETLFEASKKGEKVGIPTPSTVSKFEWNYGNVDDVAPYELPNGRFGAGADDLVVGDEVGYLGEPHIVVDVQAQGRGWGGPPPTMIGIVPEGKANTYRYFDFIDDEIRYRMDDVVDVELNDLPDELTVQNLQDLARDGDDWTIRQKAGDELRDYLDAGGEVQFETSAKTGETSGDILRMKIAKGGDSPVIKKSKLRDEIEDLYREEDWEQYLRDIYGDDHVFVEYGGGGAGSSYGPTKITIVDEGVTPEYFNQPSAYDAIDASELQAIDFDKSLAKSKMSDTEMGVLNNYYEYQEILKKLEKEWDMDIDWNHYIEDDYGQPVSYILVDVPKGFRIKP